MPYGLNRRDMMRNGIGILALPAISSAASRPPASLRFRLRETAGLRRFSYPVHLALGNLSVDAKTELSLLREGKPARSQRRVVTQPNGTQQVVLDFISSLGPLESEEYTIVIGQASNEPKGGMNVEHRDGFFRVNSGTALHYDIPENLSSLFKSVGHLATDYIDPRQDDAGFNLNDISLNSAPICGGSTRGSIIYQGPLACAIGFESETKTPQGTVAASVRLHFPSSKSWVEADLTLDDPGKIVRSMRLALPLKLVGTPTLIDLGANDTVYGQIKGDELMAISQGPNPPWKVEMGAAKSLKSFAISVPNSMQRSEGWAHVMDRQLCTAVAVADFGRENTDRIETHASGKVVVRREFADSTSRRKSFRFWFHFVPMPVQVGAATSPQAMLSPLEVLWI